MGSHSSFTLLAKFLSSRRTLNSETLLFNSDGLRLGDDEELCKTRCSETVNFELYSPVTIEAWGHDAKSRKESERNAANAGAGKFNFC